MKLGLYRTSKRAFNFWVTRSMDGLKSLYLYASNFEYVDFVGEKSYHSYQVLKAVSDLELIKNNDLVSFFKL